MGIILEIHEDDVVTSVEIPTTSIEVVATTSGSIDVINSQGPSIVIEVTTGPQGPPGGGEGGVSDGDKGDITVSGSGTVWTVDNDAITYAKIQNVSATSRFLGRITAGAGNIEELPAADAKTILALVKADVGLANVDNTSDASKPISTATQTALDAKQNLDSDLTAIAGISPTNDDVIQRKAGAWVNRTMAQLKTDLAIVAADISDFDAEVSNNTDVAANTAARHTHSNSAVLAATTASFLIADETKLDGIEAGADVTDAANVDAAGAVMNSDSSTAAMSFVIDEDNMASNLATKVPTQQSVKAYVDAAVTGGSIPDGDKGDITVSSSGTVWTIDSGAVSYAKIQDVSATSRILGRITAGAGDIEELTAANVKTILALTSSDVGLGNVNNTSDADKPVSTATQTALDGKQPLDSDLTTLAGLTATTDNFIVSVASAWASRTPAQVKTTLALNNVDNTSDANKPISTATQSALDAKQPLDSDLTTIAGLTATTDNFIVSVASAWASRTPAQVKTTLALNNVDNTSDANKPVSTATQTALDLKANDSAVVHLAGAETITGVKNFTTPKTQSAWIITRALGAGQDVTSTDEDIFKVLFGANADTPSRSFWINEWGALRIDVPSTHGSEAAIKVAPGTSADGYVLAVGTSTDINDTKFWLKNSGEMRALRFTTTPVTLTDGATINTDASLGSLFRVTLGGNRTLANPTNGIDGQTIMYELKQDGTGSRTITLGSAFNFGTDLTSITLTTTANLTDKLLVQYNAGRSEWDVIGFKKGF